MATHVATTDASGHVIAKLDADGVGQRFLYVSRASEGSKDDEREAVRLLVLALSLDGGLERAIQLLRAEATRQEEAADA